MRPPPSSGRRHGRQVGVCSSCTTVDTAPQWGDHDDDRARSVDRCRLARARRHPVRLARPRATARPAAAVRCGRTQRGRDERRRRVRTRYVSPEVGGRGGHDRGRVAKRSYDNLTQPQAFADKLTADLRAVTNNDQHVQVRGGPPPGALGLPVVRGRRGSRGPSSPATSAISTSRHWGRRRSSIRRSIVR